MSNLESAKLALEAELAHARQGFTHYQSRIEALAKTLVQIAEMDGDAAASGSTAAAPKRRKKTRMANAEMPTQKQKYVRASQGASELPFTGGDYWIDLVNAKPQSGAAILHAAIDKLGFTPTRQQVQKRTNRLTFALRALVESGNTQDSGSGRERRYFKK